MGAPPLCAPPGLHAPHPIATVHTAGLVTPDRPVDEPALLDEPVTPELPATPELPETPPLETPPPLEAPELQRKGSAPDRSYALTVTPLGAVLTNNRTVGGGDPDDRSGMWDRLPVAPDGAVTSLGHGATTAPLAPADPVPPYTPPAPGCR